MYRNPQIPVWLLTAGSTRGNDPCKINESFTRKRNLDAMGRSLHLCITAVLMLAFVLPAYGHAILLSATPGLSEVVRGPDVSIRLRFNSRVDAKRSTLSLVQEKGEQRTLAIDTKAPPDSLNSEARGLASGPYVLRWQVLAADGHITRGEVPFRVQ